MDYIIYLIFDPLHIVLPIDISYIVYSFDGNIRHESIELLTLGALKHRLVQFFDLIDRDGSNEKLVA